MASCVASGVRPVRWMRAVLPVHGTRHRQRHDVVSRRTRRCCPRLDLPPLTVRSTSSVPRPELAPHPSGLHPAGRRTALKPPYPRHDPLLQFFERWFQRCNRGYVVAAEPFSDTPVVMPSKPHEYSICASLSPYQPLAGGGFSVPALFSRDRRRRNYLQLSRLLVCLPEALQST
jgi:hypothetical protein